MGFKGATPQQSPPYHRRAEGADANGLGLRLEEVGGNHCLPLESETQTGTSSGELKPYDFTTLPPRNSGGTLQFSGGRRNLKSQTKLQNGPPIPLASYYVNLSQWLWNAEADPFQPKRMCGKVRSSHSANKHSQ